MKKLGLIVGAAALATLAGCRDPNYKGGHKVMNEATTMPDVESTQESSIPTEPEVKVESDEVKPTEVKPTEVKPAEVKPIEPEFTLYTVQRGDILSRVSKKYNVSIKSIKELNNFKDDKIRIGQKIKIPGKHEIVQAEVKPAVTKSVKEYKPYTGATKEYVVQKGDYLGKIAAANKLSVRQLRELNALASDKVRIGQKLKVPAAAEEKITTAVVTTPTADEGKDKDTVQVPVTPTTTDSKLHEDLGEDNDGGDAEPAPLAPNCKMHVVKPGESITDIAASYYVAPGDIRELNKLGDEVEVKEGQQLKIPVQE